MKKLTLLSITFFCMLTTAQAKSKPEPNPIGSSEGMPLHVIDDGGLLKLGDQIKRLDKSIEEIRGVHNDLTGLLKINNISIGDLYNNDLKQSWQWTADDWKTTLQGMSGGNNQRYQDLLRAYKSQYPAISKQDLQAKYHVLPNQAGVYANAVDTNAAVMSEAAYQYNDINKHMKEIQELSADINLAKTDKEATDLNSKLLAQLAYVQLAALRMQTLTNQQMGEQRAATLAAEKRHIEFTSHEITQ